MKKLTIITAIVLATMAIYSPRASAQVGSAGANDLMLSFRIDDGAGTGAFTNLEIDLGSQSNFTSSASMTLDSLIGSDLVATYGANWSTRTDLVWGVAGTVGSHGVGGNIVYSFDATSSNGAQLTTGALATPYLTIGNVINGFNGTSVNTLTTGDTFAGTLGDGTTHASDTPGSYTQELLNAKNFIGDYGFFNPSPTGDTTGERGVTEVNYGGLTSPIGSNELYGYSTTKVPNTTGADLGTFSLGTDGTFTFTGADVSEAPEPSTYAMMAGAMGMLFLAMRRRRSLVG